MEEGGVPCALMQGQGLPPVGTRECQAVCGKLGGIRPLYD